MTESPVRISRVIRFSRSISVCSFRNRGIATTRRVTIRTARAATATARIQVIPDSVSSTLVIPPIPMIGAYRTIRKTIVISICTCWMSLVERVIRDAVEK